MFKNIRFPIINRFTCTEGQLNSIIANIKNKNMLPILDYANENNLDCKNNYQQLINLINNYPNNLISIKLSSFNIKNNISEAESKVFNLVKLAKKNNSKILIDAENYLLQDNINFISDKLMKIFNKDKVIIYKTYQMYRKDSFEILKNDFLSKREYFIGCKLVRGAYYNEDFKYNILFDNINDTHVNYDKGIKFVIDNLKKEDILMCATHNLNSIEYTKRLIKNSNKKIEFSQLLGMSDVLSSNLAKNYSVYKYLPFGNFKDTLPYLLRRLYENYPMLLNIFK